MCLFDRVLPQATQFATISCCCALLSEKLKWEGAVSLIYKLRQSSTIIKKLTGINYLSYIKRKLYNCLTS